jgi:hypothetical protein
MLCLNKLLYHIGYHNGMAPTKIIRLRTSVECRSVAVKGRINKNVIRKYNLFSAWGSPSLVFNAYQGLFPLGVKRAEA